MAASWKNIARVVRQGRSPQTRMATIPLSYTLLTLSANHFTVTLNRVSLTFTSSLALSMALLRRHHFGRAFDVLAGETFDGIFVSFLTSAEKCRSILHALTPRLFASFRNDRRTGGNARMQERIGASLTLISS